MPGYSELIIIFLIILVLFGGKKIPEIAKGLGKGLREFKKAKEDLHSAIEEEADRDDEPRRKKRSRKIKSADSEEDIAKTEEDA